jgi:hypothetical protein
VHENPVNGYEYKVDWLKKSGEILPGAWTKSTSSRLRLDAPVGAQLTVSVGCSGNFKDSGDQINEVGVSLRYRDPDNHYEQEGQLVFTDDKSQQAWAVDLRNPDLRDYQYRYTIIYKDGRVKQVPTDGSWLAGQPGFITVGENYLLTVDIVPMLLAYSDNCKVVQVDLNYKDPDHSIEQNDSLIFSSQDSNKKTWRVPGAPGGPKSYTYQVTYFAASGATVSTQPITQAKEIVLLPPLAAVAGAAGKG